MLKRFFLLLLVLILASFSDRKLVKTKVNAQISVSLPKEFAPMTPEDLVQRYPSVRAPLGAYTNPDRLVDFSVNISATQWPDANADFARKFFKATIFNMYDRVDWISEGTETIHKKNFFYFEFESRLNPDRQNVSAQDALNRYTYIMYLVEPGRTLVFSFNCTKDQKEYWQETAKAIMHTVRVK